MCTDTLFRPDTSGGWGVYSCYLGNTADSVIFELVLSRENPAANDWGIPSFVGTIPSTFAPSAQVNVAYRSTPWTWDIKVLPDGRCYLQLMAGPAPDGHPCIIPLQTKYKK